MHCSSCTLCQPVRVFSIHAFVENTCDTSFVLGHNHMSSSIRVSLSRLFLFLVGLIIAHPAACIRSGGLCYRHAQACRGGVGLAETWRSRDCKFRIRSVARSRLTTRAICMETQPRVRSASPPFLLEGMNNLSLRMEGLNQNICHCEIVNDDLDVISQHALSVFQVLHYIS